MNHFLALSLLLLILSVVFSFNIISTNHVIVKQKIRNLLTMEVKNDATARANRES